MPAIAARQSARPAAEPTLFKCSSCTQLRPAAEMVDDVCVDCVGDAEDAEALFTMLDALDSTPAPARVEALLRELASVLDAQLPFTAFGFGVLSRKVLGWLAIVHPDLDVAGLSQQLADEIAHAEENTSELAAFVRTQLEVPTRRPIRVVDVGDRASLSTAVAHELTTERVAALRSSLTIVR